MSIAIEKRGRRIIINSSSPLPGFRTAIPGAYQSSVSGQWTAPLSMETCVLLRQKYGKQLEIGIELSRWAKGVREHRDYMADLAASADAQLEVLPRVAPKLAAAMQARTYQRVGARFIADNSASLVADDPGLGKTLEIMGGILESQTDGPYLVIAPKTAARTVWEREIKRWLPAEHRPITLPETRLAREKVLRLKRFGPTTWLIVHPEIVMTQSWLVCELCQKRTRLMAKQKRVLTCGHMKTAKTIRFDEHSYPSLFRVEWGVIVIDESHDSLIRRSGVPTQRRNGMDKLLLRADGLRIAASGTPMNSKPHQLWGTLNWLDSRMYSAFYRWAELYWAKGGYTGFDIGEFRADREDLLWDSLKSVALRRTKLEVAQDLPPKMEIGTRLNPADETSPMGIWLPMEGEQARAYEQMLKHSAAVLDSGRLEAISALAELTRLKQLACSYGDMEQRTVKSACQTNPNEIARPKTWCTHCRRHGWHVETRERYVPKLPSNKFQQFISYLEEWGYPQNPISKVVIVSFYTGLLNMFATEVEKHFKTKPSKPLATAITGKVSSRERENRLNRFNTDDHEHLMFLNVKAGGTAITIDTADRMIFLSETRIPDQQLQAEDRIHRVSNPRHCMYYYFRSLGSVDVGTSLVNKELAKGTHRLLDGRRGVDYVRHVLDLST